MASKKNRHFSRSIPILVGVVGILVSLIFWKQQQYDEERLLLLKTQQFAKYAALAIKNRFISDGQSFDRMVERWVTYKGVDKESWQLGAGAYYDHMKGVRAIEWVDKTYHVRWIVPLEGNEAAIDLNLAFEAKRETALNIARDNQTSSATGVVELVQGSKGFLVYYPLFIGSEFDGFILVVYDLKAVLDTIFKDSMNEPFILIVREGDEIQYLSSGSADSGLLQSLQVSSTADILNQQWQITAVPKELIRSNTSFISLLIGIIFSITLMLLTAAYLRVLEERNKSVKYSKELKRTGSLLNSIQENAIDGIISIDRSGIIRSINPAVEQMFGYSKEELIGENVKLLMPTPYHEEHDGYLNNYHESGEKKIIGIGREVSGLRKDGSVFPIDLSVTEILIDERKGYAGIIRDISERKEQEKKLIASEAQSTTILETVVDGIISIDAKGHILMFNRAAQQIFGYSEEEVIGQNIKMLMPTPYHEEHDGYLENYFDSGDKKIIGIGREVVGLRKDGTTFPMDLSVSEMVVLGVMTFTGIVRDISERKSQELKLIQSETQSTAILETVVDGIISIDAKGHILMFNPASQQIFGYSEEEVIGQNVKMLMPAPYHEEHDGYLNNYHKSGDKKIIGIGREVVGLRKDGTTFPMELSVSEMVVEGVKTFTGIVRDITEQKEAEKREAEINKKISDQKDYYESVIDYLAAPIFVLDNEHNVINWNKACEDLTGLPEAEVIGTDRHWDGFYRHKRKMLADVILDKDFSNIKELYPEHFSKSELIKEGYFVETWNDMKDGKHCYVRAFANPVRDDQGNIIAVVQVLFDMTHLKESYEALEKNREELMRSNRELERFAYVASHDLQEPLRMVASYTDLLERRYKDKLDDDAKEFIYYASDGAKRMQQLIQDLLAFSRVGTRGEKFIEVDCNKLIKSIIHDFQFSFAESNAELTSDELPVIFADSTQIRQLFQNLINNAVKYSDPERFNKIHIAVEQSEQYWKFSISDNGIGIEEQYYEQIFEVFRRLHNKSKYSGTGIGLAVCRRIVERHGGEIWLESMPDSGSTFHFTIAMSDINE